jgi:hypothetical protein
MSDTVSTILILAVVALFEGVRRLPPDAFVLRRVLGGRWRAVTPLELGRDFVLIAWPIPIVYAIALRRDGDADERVGIARHGARLRARARRTRMLMAALRAWGTVILLALVVGAPVATLRWDAFGLVASVVILFLMCVIQALATHAAMRRAGATRRSAVLTSLRMLWPFSAPSAAELVQLQVVRGAPWILVLIELLGRDGSLATMRAGLYDALRQGEVNSLVSALYGRDAIAAFLTSPADSGGHPFCPRCGAQYREGIEACVNCEGVALIR